MDVGRASRKSFSRPRRANRRTDRKHFSRTASRTRRENGVGMMRGGTRL